MYPLIKNLFFTFWSSYHHNNWYFSQNQGSFYEHPAFIKRLLTKGQTPAYDENKIQNLQRKDTYEKEIAIPVYCIGPLPYYGPARPGPGNRGKPEANNGPRLSEQYENEPQENLPSLCDYINDPVDDGI